MTDNKQPTPNMLSERSFGLIFAAIFLCIALFPLIFGEPLRQWAMILMGAFGLPALIFPKALRPLNIAWVHFGQFMHRIVNPILMGLIFFVAVLPTGLMLKLFGKDPMRRKMDPNATTYWIPRENEDLTRDSFDNQF
ncbi:hypothetical protein NBRC116583_38040 [Arenicella sp. 4NH20-0111]|uniref:SxtJ family membrane protein n=1 Tax=Arenicella sp. 4NH20-0111 TaxID=3127648 RepID=UPI0031047BBE